MTSGGSDRQLQLATYLLGGVVGGVVRPVEGQAAGRGSYTSRERERIRPLTRKVSLSPERQQRPLPPRDEGHYPLH